MLNIENYEAMAKLKLPDNEREWINIRADMLISSFSELEKINTDDVNPMVTVLDLQNILRDDITVKMLPREEILSNAPEQNAPEQYDGYFQVPRTLE